MHCIKSRLTCRCEQQANLHVISDRKQYLRHPRSLIKFYKFFFEANKILNLLNAAEDASDSENDPRRNFVKREINAVYRNLLTMEIICKHLIWPVAKYRFSLSVTQTLIRYSFRQPC